MAGIYIHIPFCKARCGYCDFFSSTDLGRRAQVLGAIRSELGRRSEFLAGEPVETVYVGGGTPSLCAARELGGLLRAVAENFDTRGLCETTVEANPDDLAPSYLDGLLDAGFDRISIGVQSFRDRDLRSMGRRHDGEGAVAAVANARRAGFGNISIDLIFGVPGMDSREWERNLDTALGLGVEHISAYHLGIEEGTPFARSGMRPVPEQTSREQYALLHAKLTGGGFDHYEISNFARPGFRSRHNSNYWRRVPYLGVGPSAHSFRPGRREWNAGSLAQYSGEAPARGGEDLSAEDIYNEALMLGLRTAEGIDARDLEAELGSAAAERFESAAAHLVGPGLLERDGRRYRIPWGEFLIADAIIGRLFV